MSDDLEASDMAQGHDRIMIIGPRSDGTYVVEFQTAAGQSLAILHRRCRRTRRWGMLKSRLATAHGEGNQGRRNYSGAQWPPPRT